MRPRTEATGGHLRPPRRGVVLNLAQVRTRARATLQDVLRRPSARRYICDTWEIERLLHECRDIFRYRTLLLLLQSERYVSARFTASCTGCKQQRSSNRQQERQKQNKNPSSFPPAAGKRVSMIVMFFFGVPSHFGRMYVFHFRTFAGAKRPEIWSNESLFIIWLNTVPIVAHQMGAQMRSTIPPRLRF